MITADSRQTRRAALVLAICEPQGVRSQDHPGRYMDRQTFSHWPGWWQCPVPFFACPVQVLTVCIDTIKNTTLMEQYCVLCNRERHFYR